MLLCQVHPQLPLYKAFTWYVDGVAKKLDVKTVKVADLLAPVGTPCYYYHSRTGPAKDEIPSARDQLVVMWKTWINTNMISIHDWPLWLWQLVVQKMTDCQGC